MSTGEPQSTSRRQLLTTAARATLVASAAAPLAGCAWLLRHDLQPVCPTSPQVSLPAGPLTIDAHCHIFNGSDLQVREFFSRVAVRQRGALGIGAVAIGDVLEHLAWSVAPDGAEELARLAEIADALKSCSDAGHAQRISALRQDGYRRGRAQLQDAMRQTTAAGRARATSIAKAAGVAMMDDAATNFAREQALAVIEALPPTVEAYQARSQAEASSLAPQSLEALSVQGLIDFVLQNFQWRYVSIHDYLRTYNRPGERVVDLMLPSMVDYDFWLARGMPTHTPLADQVSVMRQLAIVTGGRVHGFVPFDPLRQVAFDLGHASQGSFDLVQRAVREDGCVGVKLYPPMGFAPLGNAAHDGKRFWRRDWLPAWTDRADLGRRLDAAMRQLFSWCQEDEVPVMAHTGASNGPADQFEALTDARYWAQALDEFKRLRVSFGHFGGSAPVEDGLERARSFISLMHAGPASPGSRAFADAGFFVEVLSREPALEALVRRLYAETSSRGDAALSDRFMYGTDWEMTLTEGAAIGGYLGGFEALFADLETQPAVRGSGRAGLAERFFGVNAARWAGLAPGGAARERLDAFYRTHAIDPPDWAAKVDADAARGG